MTKQGATKLANSMIDYFVKLAGDIRRSNVVLRVNELEILDTDDEATCEIEHPDKIFTIELNISSDSTTEYVTRAICHELAHVLTGEWKLFYDKHIDTDGENTIAEKDFKIYDETVAYRHEDIYLELWKLRGKK